MEDMSRAVNVSEYGGQFYSSFFSFGRPTWSIEDPDV